jgi:phosphatidylglycerol lysyltransferase
MLAGWIFGLIWLMALPAWAVEYRLQVTNVGFLNMAPLAGLEDRPLAPRWNRLAGLVFRHGEHFYNFQGLRQFKAKFDPAWGPNYLASSSALALPRILANTISLTSRGLKGAIAE